jgi:hypothetical protein
VFESLSWGVLAAVADFELPPTIFIAMYVALALCIGIEIVTDELSS